MGACVHSPHLLTLCVAASQSQYLTRRDLFRANTARFPNSGIHVSFVLASGATASNADGLTRAREEAARHGDIVFVNIAVGADKSAAASAALEGCRGACPGCSEDSAGATPLAIDQGMFEG